MPPSMLALNSTLIIVGSYDELVFHHLRVQTRFATSLEEKLLSQIN